jgi:hypothetical protein
MARSILSALLIALLSGCAALGPPDDWSKRDTLMVATFQVANALDARSTQRIHETPGVEEVGPLARAALGAQPDPSETLVYFATRGLAHYLIMRTLPKKWRPWFGGAHIVSTAHTVKENCDLGLCD